MRGYAAHVWEFEDFCNRHPLVSYPANEHTLALFITELAQGGAKYATLTRKLAAIAQLPYGGRPRFADDQQGYQIAATRDCHPDWHGSEAGPTTEKDELRTVVEAIREDTLTGLCNKVILVLCFADAFRPSKQVAVEIEQLSF